MTFNKPEDVKGLTGIQIICKISQNPSITPIDEKLMVGIAKKIGFPNAQATYGIMYTNPPHEPPMGVDQFAQTLVKGLKLDCQQILKK